MNPVVFNRPDEFAALAENLHAIAEASYMPSHIVRSSKRLARQAKIWEKEMADFMARSAPAAQILNAAEVKA